MATVSDAPSGQASAQEYRCHWRDARDVECNGLLLRSRDNRGVLHGVYCPKCRRRTTVFLGGRRALDE